jgi:hypothetical protein
MKFKEQRSNVFVFDGGNAVGELELKQGLYGGMICFIYKEVMMFGDLHIKTMMGELVPYKDIQTAVNLMQILIEEGLV